MSQPEPNPEPSPKSNVSAWPWAHLLTGGRLLITAPCAYSITQGFWWLAAALFTFAALSDYYDGQIARANATQSNFGGLFDHTTDAIFVASGLWALSTQNLGITALPVLVILAFAQYSLDSAALAGAKLRANWLGRTNGIAYFVLVGIGIGWGLLQLPRTGAANLPLWISWLLCVSTLASMLNRAVYWLRHRAN